MFPSPTLSLPSLLILTSATQAYILHLSHTVLFILAEKEFKKEFPFILQSDLACHFAKVSSYFLTCACNIFSEEVQ